MSNSPILIDLFCGAGGLSCGLEQAGFAPVLAVDADTHALATYRANNPHAITIQSDIAKVTGSQIKELIGTSEVDLVAGGPSCQGYSTHGKRIEEDPRNFLFKHFVRLVNEIRPKFFLMENVKGLLTYRKGHFRKEIERAFTNIGYNLICKVICAADYGVPQLRHRIVFLGTRLDIDLSFPEPTHGVGRSKPHVTVGEAIGDIPLLKERLDEPEWAYASPAQNSFQRYARARAKSDLLTLHQANGLTEMSRNIVARIKEGQGLRSVPAEYLPNRFKKMRTIKDGSLRRDCTTLYYRLNREKPAYTITCYFRNVASGPFVHPQENRSLSFREAARLMSFQDNYQFHGAMTARQIGNAVPPLMAKALGKHVIQLLQSTTPTRPHLKQLTLV